MASDRLSRYVWLVDTIRRYGRITLKRINELWLNAPVGNGTPLPRRTFANYRQAVEELFNINIDCDPATFEYYIADGTDQQTATTNWLLDSAATNELISGARDITDRIFLENVPSAREFLAPVISAIRAGVQIRFDYQPYTRSRATNGIVFEPYFVKIFKQRWYVVGRNVDEDRIKTYALDRLTGLTMLDRPFAMPADFSPAEYFTYAFGIVVDHSEPRKVVLRVDATQAKYFRALPLHPSQQELVHDTYSEFTYHMRITDDLISELLSYGPAVTAIEPKELTVKLKTRLAAALANYSNS